MNLKCELLLKGRKWGTIELEVTGLTPQKGNPFI